MTSLVHRFLSDESGATAIEYGLIVGLIFLVIVSSVTLFASKVTLTFARISDAVGAVVG